MDADSCRTGRVPHTSLASALPRARISNRLVTGLLRLRAGVPARVHRDRSRRASLAGAAKPVAPRRVAWRYVLVPAALLRDRGAAARSHRDQTTSTRRARAACQWPALRGLAVLVQLALR